MKKVINTQPLVFYCSPVCTTHRKRQLDEQNCQHQHCYNGAYRIRMGCDDANR
jgi:hypothetical protein